VVCFSADVRAYLRHIVTPECGLNLLSVGEGLARVFQSTVCLAPDHLGIAG
jgi:hypothetical protein